MIGLVTKCTSWGRQPHPEFSFLSRPAVPKTRIAHGLRTSYTTCPRVEELITTPGCFLEFHPSCRTSLFRVLGTGEIGAAVKSLGLLG